VNGSGSPLIGRQVEQARLRAILRAGGGAVVRGGLGIGKTALVRSVVDELFDCDVETTRTVWIVAQRANLTPLGALSALVGDDQGGDAPTAGISRVADALNARELVVVDDIQWLDDESLAALSLAAGRGARIVATIRSGESPPDLVRRLMRDHGHERIDLDRLDDNSVAAIVRTLLGEVDEQSVSRIVVRAQGNPLYAREIVRDLTESGVLEREQGTWFWTGDASVRASTSLREVVADRLANLPDDEADTLRMIAFAQPLTVAHLRRIASDDIVHRLERRELVTEFGGAVRVAHPVFVEVLRATTGPLETRSMLARLTSLLPLDDLDDGDALRWSYWALDGELDLDPSAWMRLVRAAFTVSDRGHALVLALRAVDAGGGFDAQAATGRAHALLGDVDAADAELRPIVLDTTLDPGLRTQAARYLLYAHGFRPQDADTLDEFVRWTLDSLPDDDDREEITVQWAALLALGARFAAAGKLALPRLDHPAPRVALRALTPAGSALLAIGQCRRATEIARERLPLAIEHVADVPEGLGWAFTVMCTGQMYDGQVDAMTTSAAIAMASLNDREHGEDVAQIRAIVSLVSGRAALLAGRLRTARAHLLAALAVYRRYDPQRWWALTAAHLAETAALMGDARASSSAAAESGERVVHVPARVTEMERSLAWQHVAIGNLDAARAALHLVVEQANREEFLPTAMFAAHDLTRLGDRDGAAVIRERVARFDSGWATPYRTMATGLIDGDEEAYRRAGEGFEAIGVWLHAAEAWCAGSVLLRDRGRHRSGRAFAERAHGALERCEGVRSPTLLGLTDTVVLTPRERQVAMAAAAGTTTKQIANDLELSPRTVDNLLSRAYQKMGINRRGDLREALGLDASRE
jgi:DNA-binding CsgD family transcriptional regulator/chromosome segregation and condensation protein ScpB